MSLSRKYLDKTVYDATRERIEELFFRFDTVAVSFSGGKDSTAVLNITLEVAEELGRLPVKVVYWDEEAQYSDTIDYIARVAEDPRVDMHWYCVPIKHRNACSYKEPFWYPWNPEKEELWVRDKPDQALGVDDLPGFEWGMTHGDTPGCLDKDDVHAREERLRYVQQEE